MINMEIIGIITALTGAIVAALVSYLAQQIAKRKKEEEAKIREIYSNKLYDLWNEYDKEIKSGLKDEDKVDYYEKNLKYLLLNYQKSWRNLLVHYPSYPIYLARAEIETEAHKEFDELKKHVEEIENRFPKEATLEKIASVNDAILATKFEALSESIKRIEDKLLTKWDVAKVIFQILAALGVLIGVIFAILQYT